VAALTTAPISEDEERVRFALRSDPDVAALLPVLDETIDASTSPASSTC
jgi:hypothetical protein